MSPPRDPHRHATRTATWAGRHGPDPDAHCAAAYSAQAWIDCAAHTVTQTRRDARLSLQHGIPITHSVPPTTRRPYSTVCPQCCVSTRRAHPRSHSQPKCERWQTFTPHRSVALAHTCLIMPRPRSHLPNVASDPQVDVHLCRLGVHLQLMHLGQRRARRRGQRRGLRLERNDGWPAGGGTRLGWLRRRHRQNSQRPRALE